VVFDAIAGLDDADDAAGVVLDAACDGLVFADGFGAVSSFGLADAAAHGEAEVLWELAEIEGGGRFACAAEGALDGVVSGPVKDEAEGGEGVVAWQAYGGSVGVLGVEGAVYPVEGGGGDGFLSVKRSHKTNIQNVRKRSLSTPPA